MGNISQSKIVCLTGATGFVGEALMHSLMSCGYIVRVLTRNKKSYKFPDEVEIFEGDLDSKTDWFEFLDGAQTVIHSAGEIENFKKFYDVNFYGSRRLLDSAVLLGVPHWIQISSVGAYGRVKSGNVTEDSLESPIGPYESSKTDFDNYLKCLVVDKSTKYTILRPSIIYGNSMKNKSVKKIISLIKRRLFFYVGSSESIVNYVHINDVVSAVLSCLNSKVALNNTYILSDSIRLERMVVGIADQMCVSPPFLRVPASLAYIIGKLFSWIPNWPLTPARIYFLSNKVTYDSSKIKRDLCWKITVPISEGMRQLAKGNNF